MLSKFLIYGLYDPITQELRYIGKSCSGMKRINRHFNEAHKMSSPYKDRWVLSLRQFGKKPEIVIIEEHVRAEDLPTAEREWIAEARRVGCRLTNLTDGGDGTAGRIGSERQRTMLVARNKARKGFKHSEETKLLLSKASKGLPKSKEFKEKISKANKGRIHTDSSRVKTSRALGGKPIIDENGIVYQTIREAARALHVDEANIRLLLRGKLKTTGGHTFLKLEG